ncbi:MAG: TolC family protein [Sphingobacterium sp.]|nr:TolC family protein [Sphingobacterium sp.]
MLFTAAVVAQELKSASVPSLQELIRRAIDKDYSLRNKQLDVAITDEERQKVKDSFLPKISISASDMFSYMSIGVKSKELIIPSLNIDISTDHNRFNTSNNTLSAGADLSMLVYSGGKVSHSQKALAHKSEAQKLIMETDRQQIMSDLLEAYDQLALLKQVKKVLLESTVRLAENRKIADKALAYGLTTKYEYQKIEVAQAQLVAKVAEYTGKRELVLKQLFLLTNIDAGRLTLIDNDLESILVTQPQNGIENRAEIKSLGATMRAAEYKVRAEKTWFTPKVSLMGSVAYLGMFDRHLSSSKPLQATGQKLSSSAPTITVFPMMNIGVGAKWDVFDGRTGKHEVRKAEFELKQIENQTLEVTEKLELNLEKCKTDYIISLTQITVKAAQQVTAENALKQATKEFRTGLVRSIQLIDAENDFQQASLDYINGVYTQRRAAVNLLMATGNLDLTAITQ